MSKKSPFIIIIVIALLIILITVLNSISKNAPGDENRPEPFPKGEISAISEFVDDIADDRINGNGSS